MSYEPLPSMVVVWCIITFAATGVIIAGRIVDVVDAAGMHSMFLLRGHVIVFGQKRLQGGRTLALLSLEEEVHRWMGQLGRWLIGEGDRSGSSGGAIGQDHIEAVEFGIIQARVFLDTMHGQLLLQELRSRSV